MQDCSICGEPIEPFRDSKGNITWAGGHNAQPINDGTCCNTCNKDVVTPQRFIDYNNRTMQPEVMAEYMEESIEAIVLAAEEARS